MAQQSGWQIYKRLLSYAARFWPMYLAALISTILYAIIETELVAGFQYVIDDALIEKDIEFLNQLPFIIVIAVLFLGIASFLSVYCFEWIGRKIVQVLRVEVFRKYLKLPIAYFDKEYSGDLVSKITFNAETVTQAATQAISNILRSGGIIIYALVKMMMISWSLTLFYLIAAPVIALVVNAAAKRFRKISHRIQDSMGQVTQLSQEAVEGVKVIKTYGGHDYENEQFSDAASNNFRQSLKLTATKAFSSALVQFIAAAGLAFVFWIAIKQYLNGEFSAGQFVAFFMLIMYIMKPLKDLSNVNSVLQRGIAGADSLFQILDEQEEVDKGTITLDKAKGAITFDSVTFSYDQSKTILKDFSLQINPGETVALVGPSGSGKSTVTNLLLKFYHPDSGRISLDGKDIESITVHSLRQQFAYVSQQIVLFNDSVKANIAYGELKFKPTDDLADAIEHAYLSEVVDSLEDGLSTNVGNAGARLSGGQRQRIAIARALLKNAPILIMDEATSALDNESEKKIQQALDYLMQGRTTIVIAHRLSTIESADKIIVMKEGQIAEQGTHSELLEKQGEYHKLYQMQFSE
ncbi:lipid A export permease/ATP-binding protein MsbA [Pleionea mediterranea]|jgi:subfamily B ATP-binding cassette protein MsbA|uniref:Lipid A export permease/ATP-binding protein MsbA n=1 Tax=Pleionea mediterranea TaxID=523701 RepID=A0A316FS07_9GAMM|nr:lipid A export permease/ATP-binding protein MsbA [Pleionea mediterranea]PWK50952.1 lipid A export permease/ATP-binding protein MsbA [Pleionea mediterranea]